jgi:hypothetical protein
LIRCPCFFYAIDLSASEKVVLLTNDYFCWSESDVDKNSILDFGEYDYERKVMSIMRNNNGYEMAMNNGCCFCRRKKL